jgi:hypothetical protein
MAGERNISEPQVPLRYVHPLEAEIATLAARQHGVVSSSQLQSLGLSDRAVRKRCAAARLHRLHRSVYAVGHTRLTLEGRWMAAVLAGGPGAVLSYRPAGGHWNLRRWTGRPAITVPTRRRSSGPIEIHCSTLPDDEWTTRDGIPITTVPRTILDLATLLDHHDLARVIEEAEFQQLADELSLPTLLERHRGERGTRRVAAAIEASGYGKGVTRRELEELFVRFVVAAGIPHPELNATVQLGGRFVSPDCLWRRQRTIVELHSARYHGTTPAISRDAARDRKLTLAGYTVIHVTWAQLQDRTERDALARDLRSFLAYPARR